MILTGPRLRPALSRPGRCSRVMLATATLAVSIGCGDATAPRIVPAASVTVSPASLTLAPGDSAQVIAAALSASGAPLQGRRVAWTTDQPAVATVSDAGTVRGVAEGTANITATVDDKLAIVAVRVRLPVTSVSITPHAATVLVGSTVTLTATARSGSGGAIPGRAATWTSLDSSATVDRATGVVSGQRAGVAHIVALIEDRADTATITVQAPPPSLASVGAGEFNACVLTGAGQAYCWGEGGFGALGNGSTADMPTPTAVAGSLTFTTLAVGYHDSCGLVAGGAAYCWGNTPALLPGGIAFTSIAGGAGYMCGLTAAGRAYCWGSNYQGRLGTGDTVSYSAPTPVATTQSFASIAAGVTHTCGVTRGGAGYCWGQNDKGQLGDGTRNTSTVPVPVSGGLTFRYIGSGEYHSCGLTSAGAAYCWGYDGAPGNYSGALGVGPTAPAGCTIEAGMAITCLTPQPVAPAASGPLDFAMLRVGWEYACGLTPDGLAYCWGSNWEGVLGSESLGGGDRNVPTVAESGMRFADIATSRILTCGIAASRQTVKCWGYQPSGTGSFPVPGSTSP